MFQSGKGDWNLARPSGTENAYVEGLRHMGRLARVHQISARVLLRNWVGEAPKRRRKQRLK